MLVSNFSSPFDAFLAILIVLLEPLSLFDLVKVIYCHFLNSLKKLHMEKFLFLMGLPKVTIKKLIYVLDTKFDVVCCTFVFFSEKFCIFYV